MCSLVLPNCWDSVTYSLTTILIILTLDSSSCLLLHLVLLRSLTFLMNLFTSDPSDTLKAQNNSTVLLTGFLEEAPGLALWVAELYEYGLNRLIETLIKSIGHVKYTVQSYCSAQKDVCFNIQQLLLTWWWYGLSDGNPSSAVSWGNIIQAVVNVLPCNHYVCVITSSTEISQHHLKLYK